MKLASVGVLHDWTPGSAKEVFQAVGSLDDIDVFGTNVLIGVYQRSNVSRGGLILSSSATDDKWQGKCGLVLKIGPTAFNPDSKKLLADFGGRFPVVGEWVFHEVRDSVQLSYKGAGAVRPKGRDEDGWPVRLVYAADLLGRIKDPNSVI